MESKLRITVRERQALLEQYRKNVNPRIRLQVRILVLLAKGYSWAVIASVLFCGAHTMRVHPDLSLGIRPRNQTEAEVGLGTTELHHQVTRAVFPQPNSIFDDPTPFDADDDFFDRDPPACYRLIACVLCRRQVAPHGLLDRPCMLVAGQITAQKPRSSTNSLLLGRG